jgi:glutamine amidotransferase
MCRLAGYAGPPLPLSALLYDPPRSLSEQAVEPREQRSGRVNVDGTGIAWWDGGDPRPLRYRSERPPWADENLAGLAPRIAAPVQLAAVRSATPGIPHGTPFVHPFVHGGLAGAHNGWIASYRERVARRLLDRLPDHLFGSADGMSDSIAIFLLAVAERQRRPETGLAGALRAALAATAEECRRAGVGATLNVALADASGVAVARFGAGEPGNSLYTRSGDGHLVASEPLDDDPAWTAVPDGCIAVLTRTGIDLEELL